MVNVVDESNKVFSRLSSRIQVLFDMKDLGALIHQTRLDIWMPIGFKGAVEEPVSGVTIFNGDLGLPPYDSHIGQVIYINVLSFAMITHLSLSLL